MSLGGLEDDSPLSQQIMRAEAGGRYEQKEIRLQIFARTRNRAANQHIVHYHCVDPHVLKIDHQKEQRKCVCVCAHVVFTRAYQHTRAPVPRCNCVRWISRRNAVALDHFNHFLLYLWQLLGEVEITAWLWCFPPLTALNKGETHMLCPRAFRLQTYLQLCDVGPSLRSNRQLTSFCSRCRAEEFTLCGLVERDDSIVLIRI